MRKTIKDQIEEKYNIILDDTDFSKSVIKHYKKNKELSQKQISCFPKKN